MMKAAVKNKEIEIRGELDDPQAVQVLSVLVKQRMDSIEHFSRGGRPELAAQEAAEIKVIEGYLPATAGEEEIAAVVEEVIRATGASSPKDMGKVMKECMLRFSGKPVDGKRVSALVKQRLESP